MPFHVFLAPQTTPDKITLQADVDTWQQVALHLKRKKLGGLSALIERQLGRDTADRARVARLDFADDQGRDILRALGLSA